MTIKPMPNLYKLFLAFFHLSNTAVCEMSTGKGLADYHDYADSTTPEPWHDYEHTCSRCGKRFTI